MEKPPGVIKRFLNKPMAEATIGDFMIQHAGMVVISIAVASSIQIAANAGRQKRSVHNRWT